MGIDLGFAPVTLTGGVGVLPSGVGESVGAGLREAGLSSIMGVLALWAFVLV